MTGIEVGIKVAFGSVPKDSGTFTFYRNLRPVLQKYGIELTCVTVGQREASLIEASYVDDGCVLLASESTNVKHQAQVFAQWCEQASVDIVMAINSVAILSALPYLPANIRVVSRCANGFEEGYQVTLSGRERLMKIIALTPRLKTDLVEKYAVDPDRICLIPNGVDPALFSAAASRQRSASSDQPIQLGFMGRLEHKQKGVLHLPKIVEALKQKDIPFQLKIAGKGVHRELLERELRPFIASGEVTMVGAIAQREIPDFLAATDVFLFTSHFEGCPNALLEAMMAGCVPIAFLIEGITDFLIEQGRTGFVVPKGDSEQVASHIAQLLADSALLPQLSAAVARAARERFTSEVAAGHYAECLAEVMRSPLPHFDPLPWSQFKIDPTYQKRWTAHIPKPLKTIAKRVISRKAVVP